MHVRMYMVAMASSLMCVKFHLIHMRPSFRSPTRARKSTVATSVMTPLSRSKSGRSAEKTSQNRVEIIWRHASEQQATFSDSSAAHAQIDSGKTVTQI